MPDARLIIKATRFTQFVTFSGPKFRIKEPVFKRLPATLVFFIKKAFQNLYVSQSFNVRLGCKVKINTLTRIDVINNIKYSYIVFGTSGGL